MKLSMSNIAFLTSEVEVKPFTSMVSMEENNNTIKIMEAKNSDQETHSVGTDLDITMKRNKRSL